MFVSECPYLSLTSLYMFVSECPYLSPTSIYVCE
jgi:hypothetical protein